MGRGDKQGTQWLAARPALLPLAFTLRPSGTQGQLSPLTLTLALGLALTLILTLSPILHRP